MDPDEVERWADAPGLAESAGRYQPRYLAYCRANGLTPESDMARAEKCGEARMLRFILWMSERRGEFCTVRGLTRSAFDLYIASTAGAADYTSWLAQRAEELAPRRCSLCGGVADGDVCREPSCLAWRPSP